MLMPSHAKNVKLYNDTQPLLSRYGVENQLDAMFSPVVQLRSGGYIVLNQAEAWSPSTSTPAAPRASITSRTPRSRPIWRRPTKSPASFGCAISPG